MKCSRAGNYTVCEIRYKMPILVSKSSHHCGAIIGDLTKITHKIHYNNLFNNKTCNNQFKITIICFPD